MAVYQDGINGDGPVTDHVCPKCNKQTLYGKWHMAIYHDSYFGVFCLNKEDDCDYMEETTIPPVTHP
jgi:hypothetical protein